LLAAEGHFCHPTAGWLTNTATPSTNRTSAAAPFSASTAEALAQKFVSFAEAMMPSSWVSLTMGDLLILDF